MPLPLLREELALLPGAVMADGQPSHTLHDPVRSLFFQIDWPTFEVLHRWQLGNPAAIAAAISAETTLMLEAADVENILRFFAEHQLLQPEPGSASAFAARLKQREGSLGHKLLHHYLFFRIPLLRPDAWLGRWANRLDFFYSRHFLYLTLAALLLGLVAIYRQWELFTATLVDTLSWSGLVSYGLTLVVVKTLHELGHGFTAKRFGCRVPTMGVAFLVLWPVAYTDTNEVWKLVNRSQRLAVSAAGILTELTIAAWATLAWALLPDGTLKTTAFLLATTTWVSTIAINASPFMRFDGYFLLSDWLGMPNLHQRAFALARWDLRERLFALGEPAPEAFTTTRQRGLILFAYATWIYRLVVFLGIAALVYAFFIKAVGILLFMVEIGWFVLLPMKAEMQAWHTRWPVIKTRRRAWGTGLLGLTGLLLLALPWPSSITSTGLLRPTEQFVVYAPPHAQVVALPFAEGAQIKAGQPLLRLSASVLESSNNKLLARRERLRWQASAGAFDTEQRAQWQVSAEQLATTEAELTNIRAEVERYAPNAPFSGVLRYILPDMQPGDWLADQEPLARLVSEQNQVVVTYLDEHDISRITIGDRAMFYADNPDSPVVSLVVASIDQDSSRILPEPELSSTYGGGIAVREKQGRLYPEHPIYRVTLKVTQHATHAFQHAWRGKVTIHGRWAVPGWRYLQSAVALFWREAGF